MLKGWRGRKHSHSEHDSFCTLSEEERNKEYHRIASRGWDYAWDIYHNRQGWKLMAGRDDVSGAVFAKHIDNGKVFKLEGYVDAHWEAVFEQLVHGDNESPAWNPTVLHCRTLQKLNENTDIAYNISCSSAGGLVSSRDYVNLRHWKSKDGLCLSLGQSVFHPDMPPNKKYVRAENNPAAWVFKHISDAKSHFTLILKSDLKGWLPHSVVDQAMGSVLVNYIHVLRMRLKHVLENGGTVPHKHAPRHDHDSPTNKVTDKLNTLSMSNGHTPRHVEEQTSEEE